MKFIIWLVAIIVFLYTCGFGISLWKDKNRSGAVIVILLGIVVVVVPYFSNLV